MNNQPAPWLQVLFGVALGLLLASVIFFITTTPRGKPIELVPLPTDTPLTAVVNGQINIVPTRNNQETTIVVVDTLPSPVQIPEKAITLGIGMIDLNHASQAELELLPGIGPAKAKDIIDYRNEKGYFKTIEEIKNVPAIGDSIFEKIKEFITVKN